LPMLAARGAVKVLAVGVLHGEGLLCLPRSTRAAGSGGASASRQRCVESYLAEICDHVAGRGSFDRALPDVADFHQTFELKTRLIDVATSIAGPLQLLKKPDFIVS
jgi:hypothetical protein